MPAMVKVGEAGQNEQSFNRSRRPNLATLNRVQSDHPAHSQLGYAQYNELWVGCDSLFSFHEALTSAKTEQDPPFRR